MGQFFSVCGQICGQGVPGRTKQAEIVTRMAGLKQIMEIFKAINQPLSSEQRVRWYKQRGLQRFFIQILMVYRRFCSFSFTLRHSLEPVFPHVPRLSVAGYVVRRNESIKVKLNSPLDFVAILCGLNLQNEVIDHFPFAVYVQFVPMRHIVFQLLYIGLFAVLQRGKFT